MSYHLPFIADHLLAEYQIVKSSIHAQEEKLLALGISSTPDYFRHLFHSSNRLKHIPYLHIDNDQWMKLIDPNSPSRLCLPPGYMPKEIVEKHIHEAETTLKVATEKVAELNKCIHELESGNHTSLLVYS